VHQGVAEFAALVDGSGCFRCDVTRDAAGEGELAEQCPYPVLVLADAGIHLAVGALQVGVRDQTRTAVAGSGDIERIEVAVLDHAIHVGVQQVQSGRGAPVPEESRLDMLGQQRFPQQRVVQQIDLPDRQVVGGAPVSVDQVELRGIDRSGRFQIGVDFDAAVHVNVLQEYSRNSRSAARAPAVSSVMVGFFKCGCCPAVLGSR